MRDGVWRECWRVRTRIIGVERRTGAVVYKACGSVCQGARLWRQGSIQAARKGHDALSLVPKMDGVLQPFSPP